MSDQESRLRLEGADLISDVMGEALDSHPEPEPQLERSEPPKAPRGDYYTAAIAEKRKRFKELADKLSNHQTNRAYVKQDANGNDYIDFAQMTADQAQMALLGREIDDYREEAANRKRTASERFETARTRALAYARAETGRVPEALRRRVAEKFIDLFNGVSDNRIWERARYANVANIDLDIQQLWESAVGSVTRSTWGGSGNPAPSGLDGGEPKRDEETVEEDPFVNNLKYAYEQRKARSMTFAEAKRARAEAQQQREGGQQ